MNWILHIFKGMAIGLANIIPGVSGGTIAVVLGIYEKLTESIGEFFSNKDKQKEYLKFLTQIGIGALLGIIIFSKIIEYLYNNFYEQTSFFFLGLIISSIPFIINTSNNMKISLNKVFFFFIGFLLIFLMIFLEKNGIITVSNNNIDKITLIYGLKLLFCGILAAGAMVLPGLSGSFLLIILGEYNNILGFVNERELLPISIVGIGAIIGILSFAKVIDYLLKNHESAMMYFILGLITASLIGIFPGISLGLVFIVDIILLILGYLSASIISKKEK